MTWGLVFAVLSFVCGYFSVRLAERMLRRHRQAGRVGVPHERRPQGGRPRIDRELAATIPWMSTQNPLWGAPRIHGELLKLGFRVSQSSVSRYMLARGGRPTQGWATFLRNHAGEVAMVCVPTLTFRRLYAFVVFGHRSRAILQIEVAGHSTAGWRAYQIGKAFAFDALAAFLARDDEGSYKLTFRRPLRGMGIRDGPAMPPVTGPAERFIGSFQRERLDRLIIVNAGHLRRVLTAYARSYNESHTKLARDGDSPNRPAVEPLDAIET